MNISAKHLIRLPEVKTRVAMSKAQIYKLISKDEFPKQIKVGNRISAWVSSEIDLWIEQRILLGR
jgi:prophage regulatory protein